MEHLENVDVEDLQHALDEVDGKRETQRLTAAIAYKNGISQTELAEWFDVERKTIYNWLTRLDEASLAEAASDNQRSGRNRKLSENELESFEETVHEPPAEAGYDEPAWTTALVKHHLSETYDVDYSIPSCRRLLKEAGLSYQKPRRSAAEADPEDREEFHEEIKKSGGWTPR